jgi:hypothetical protein
MENRAYTFAFLGILAIVCLGAYVSVSALFDPNGDPLVRFETDPHAPTLNALATRIGTRTPTPTNTPFILVIPTIIFPTLSPTPLPPTATPTLPPFPSPRVLPTRTPTQTPVPTNSATPVPGQPPPEDTATATTAAPPPRPTNTAVRSTFAFGPVGDVSVDRSRNCAGQYYVYGAVRDSGNQPVFGVRIRYTTQTIFPPAAVTEAKGYELTIGTADADWFLTIVDGANNSLSPTVLVRTSGLYSGNCWYLVNWRRN